MGNRGIPREPHKPADAVETTRAASVDWSNLQENYERIGNLTRLAKHYGVRFTTVRAELVRQGIPIKPRGHVKGQKKSQAWREASAKHWNDPAWRARQRKQWLERLPTMNGRAANSPLEKKLQTALIKAGISFSTQRRKLEKYVVDIELAQAPVIIEADGALHLLKKNKERDALRDAELTGAGYRVFRFSGTQINACPNECVRQVIEACGLVPDATPYADIRNGMRGEDNPRWSGGKRDYVCDVCETTFQAWPSTRLKDGRAKVVFCSKQCQREWQIANPPRTWTGEDKAKHSSRMKELWADPEWRAQLLARRAAAKKQMKI